MELTKRTHMTAFLGVLMIIIYAPLGRAGGCENAEALGTSRILRVQVDTTAGIGGSYAGPRLSRGEVILTFDDGPLPTTTPRILRTLAHECIRATFFMIGRRAEANPDLVVSVRNAGHSLGSHSYSHRDLKKLPPDEAKADIQRGYEAVEKAAFGPDATKQHARLFRFPSRKSTPELISFVRSRGGTIVSSGLSPEDWRGQPASVTMNRLRRILDRRNKGIILLHDSQENTVELLPMLIAEIKARGMRIVHLAPE
jgi:peptidoglycan/xylan/chitin deacetylase (PgdA/CDA1 family)